MLTTVCVCGYFPCFKNIMINIINRTQFLLSIGRLELYKSIVAHLHVCIARFPAIYAIWRNVNLPKYRIQNISTEDENQYVKTRQRSQNKRWLHRSWYSALWLCIIIIRIIILYMSMHLEYIQILWLVLLFTFISYASFGKSSFAGNRCATHTYRINRNRKSSWNLINLRSEQLGHFRTKVNIFIISYFPKHGNGRVFTIDKGNVKATFQIAGTVTRWRGVRPDSAIRTRHGNGKSVVSRASRNSETTQRACLKPHHEEVLFPSPSLQQLQHWAENWPCRARARTKACQVKHIIIQYTSVFDRWTFKRLIVQIMYSLASL